MPQDTIFGKIIRREIPADIVYEDDEAIAFRDIHPQAPLHVLVVPKEPLAGLQHAAEGDAALLGHLLVVAARVAAREGVAESGYRTIINAGPDGGQEVPHLHLHLLGGRPLGWPPG
ncbi:MAG: histidine triad nucleotide-binding protein [Gemmatimonadota bacterium]